MNIGLLGFGVVGQGLFTMIQARQDCTVTRVLCRRPREIPGTEVVYDIRDILDDPDISVVVECMGGLEPAFSYLRDAMLAGKHVVTSNKAVMAAYYDQLVTLAAEQGVSLRCTAAVGGGICWLSELERAKRCQSVLEIGGILNGTCNYVLDNMTRYALDYDTAIRQAQYLGYAERDPSADVEGWDTRNKVILSANVAFDISLELSDLPVAGIQNITAADIAHFSQMGLTCKLIGKAGLDYAWVQPVLFPSAAPEAAVPMNFNRIAFLGSETGEMALFGQGAGGAPTAYNVLQDLTDIGLGRGFYVPRGPKTRVHNGQKMCYYVRGGWDGPVTEDLGDAVVTPPVAVAELHQWLGAHPTAFAAALSEKYKPTRNS